MGQKGNLMTYRPDIKIVDATIRDGGLVNNFYFTDEFVKELYEANIKAGIDYMEFGYKASKDLFDPSEYGKGFCNTRLVCENVADNRIEVREGLQWGYDVPYLLTGLLNQHPGSAIDKVEAHDTRYARYYTELWDREH